MVQKTNPHPAPGCDRSPPPTMYFQKMQFFGVFRPFLQRSLARDNSSPLQSCTRTSSPCSISIFIWLRLRCFHEFVLTRKWNLVDSLQMSGCKRNPIFEEWSGIASHCSLKRQVTLEKRLWHSKAERKQLVTQLLRLIKVVLMSAILRTHGYKIQSCAY